MAEIRTLRSDDYETLHQLEVEIFGKAGYPLVCSYYLRLCTELYAESCFLALVDNRSVGYLLTFVRDREAYSTRLGVIDEYQGTGVAIHLIAACVRMLVEKDFDLCWFTVKPENTYARKLYRKIGGVERGTRRDFFAPGDELIIVEVDKPALQRFHETYPANISADAATAA